VQACEGGTWTKDEESCGAVRLGGASSPKATLGGCRCASCLLRFCAPLHPPYRAAALSIFSTFCIQTSPLPALCLSPPSVNSLAGVVTYGVRYCGATRCDAFLFGAARRVGRLYNGGTDARSACVWTDGGTACAGEGSFIAVWRRVGQRNGWRRCACGRALQPAENIPTKLRLARCAGISSHAYHLPCFTLLFWQNILL